MLCQACGVEQEYAARFCEDCGAALGTSANSQATIKTPDDPTACSHCGAGPGAFGADGFCTTCGRERLDVSRNHVEIRISPQLAGVSDIGLKHFRNEDAIALAGGLGGEALVVCDGVSRSQNPDLASADAALAVMDLLQPTLQTPSQNHTHDLITAALEAARKAVRATPFVASSNTDPPESTIVIAVRRGRRVSLGWVGDSRAYIITAADAKQCTVDHSWVNETVAAGQSTLADALRSPLAHALTRSLGGPAESSDEPSQLDIDLPTEAGFLVLCSDGLWNYLADAASLAVLVRSQPSDADALARAAALVEFALRKGGHDNISAVVLMFDPMGTP